MRLNSQIRKQIVINAIAATTIDSRIANCNKEMQIALRGLAIDSVRGSCCPEEYKKLTEKLVKNVDNFIKKTNNYGLKEKSGERILQSKWRLDVVIDGLQYGFYAFLDDNNEVVNVHSAYSHRFSSENPNAAKFVKVNNEIKNIRNEENSLKANLNAMVNSFKTVKELIKNWPESEAYIPTPAAIAHLPVLLCADLNAMMKNAGLEA